ncbi:MAG: hypothetical protein NTY07_00685 [Bacteroidia bacterium]|nr:hypothetical protein [Bacteroidia bacterium]
MTNKIIELKCFDCVKLDNYQFVASFYSMDNEKYQMTFHEKVSVDTVIRINTYYHTIQKFGDYFRISINHDYFTQERPDILELFLADKYETKEKKQISIYKDSNTLDVFRIIDKDNKRSLNSTRLLNLSKEKLIIIKEAHIFNKNYVIENWIHQLGKK